MKRGIRLRLIGTAVRALCLISPSLVAAQNATQLPTNEGNMSENLTIPDRQPHRNVVDREFAEGAASSARRQVSDANSALAASQRTDVKHIASMLRGDGERIGRKLVGSGAAGSGEAVGDGVPKSKTSAYTDGAFISDQIEMQRIEIGLFQRECRLGADAGLRTFANLTLPALQRNLQRLQALPV